MIAKRKIGFIVGMALFAAYFFLAARPIPLETVLVPCWLNSIESAVPEIPVSLDGGLFQDSGALSAERRIPFSLGGQFGYISRDGFFSVNQVKKANVSLSPERWAEYGAEPDRITVYDSNGETLTLIENPRGYPFFLDERTFLIGSEQNVISEIDRSGAVSWTYEFPAPLTCVDAAAGLVLTGSLDGVMGLVDSRGRQVFTFEPGGSRYAVILGCALSRDGSRLALISGIGDQRFLVLERYGANTSDYKVVYHEFLGDGFRRPVYISFVENDRWVVFERGGGLGFYEISARQAGRVALNGEISALDQSGGQGMVFVVISRFGDAKELIGIRLPGRVIVESPFRSAEVFLGRIDSRLIVGGGQTLVSFDLEKR
ncbi:MAG: WD40 repeat domain-containing protein [Treponema sp.]|nr:WD40 repeat domain-containing protein [Treponema sp.]